ncbi:P1 family peptidase [Arsenicicoccus dermatophilus]|uniref:P1 family peptidase n=1 Tax=Arsenicicoccus dermatophilus TaxID=1076331 RepID=UPI0039175AA0
MAGVAHDGLARAVRPVHTCLDGDTFFATASGTHEHRPTLLELTLLMEAGADCVTRAIAHAVLVAHSTDRTADGGGAWRSSRDAFPSAVAAT